jgi:hypothetical protein
VAEIQKSTNDIQRFAIGAARNIKASKLASFAQ